MAHIEYNLEYYLIVSNLHHRCFQTLNQIKSKAYIIFLFLYWYPKCLDRIIMQNNR